MQQNWDGAELARWWSLNFDELALIETKPLRTRLGFAAQMKMYRWAGRFIDHASEIPAEPVAYLAEQLSAGLTDLDGYDWAGRTGRRHREEILALLGLRRMTADDRAELVLASNERFAPRQSPQRRWLSRFVCGAGIMVSKARLTAR
ncbi:DUF4158 domain-containing protein [Ensifer aridi]|uniref:DUF4158 domain-containing protein n=1 Tax=Ensifer aridi TaxID=1708715 RepID=UPI00040AFFE1